ncbi:MULTISPECIES: ImmA/IrrE family metallo-endopeptidase [Trichocoleus]|uniref:ImmA/IrrE family metallo-endopeptidase n=1 Tax=Trichocoleus desertorum GB2-A4 TaxID=2933944 RepID=A0ABV0JHJ8_9CYAN|nr:ImmA/IrrE family metallo-endopeptidase [Trichocoleus sp. FACHB-46]MBD1865272.1 ImmA/IrrE family metallo-endopeptidase [Trichocoleus sp. FACHB-46]
MNRREYYDELKTLARNTRMQFGIFTPRILISDLRRIYKHYQIEIDLWPRRGVPPTVKLKSLRGAFFCDEYGTSVLINRFLPDAPKIFTLGHELKHYLVDKDLSKIWCGNDNKNEEIEIGAEIFSGELLFPDDDFKEALTEMGIQKGCCSPEVLVRLKRETQATLSYSGLVKKAEFLGFASRGALVGVRWRKLEEAMYGVPGDVRSPLLQTAFIPPNVH